MLGSNFALLVKSPGDDGQQLLTTGSRLGMYIVGCSKDTNGIKWSCTETAAEKPCLFTISPTHHELLDETLYASTKKQQQM